MKKQVLVPRAAGDGVPSRLSGYAAHGPEPQTLDLELTRWDSQVTVAAEQSEAEQMTRYLNDTARQLQAAKILAYGRVVEGHNPAEGILEVSEHEHADLIVMATHGRSGLQRMWLGSVALKVIHGSAAPVLLIRARRSDGNEE